MQINKKQLKKDTARVIVWVLFIPFLRIKTVRVDKNYVKEYYYLFCFLPLFAIEKLSPLKESKMTDRFDFNDM